MKAETYVLSDATMPHWFVEMAGGVAGIETPLGLVVVGCVVKEAAELLQQVLRLRGHTSSITHLTTEQVKEMCAGAQRSGYSYLAVMLTGNAVDGVVHLVPLAKVAQCGPGTLYVVDEAHRASLN